jgi:hypothetical protein
MSWYREGKINLVNGSVDVVGVGTAFKSEVRFSDILLVNGVLTEIVRAESDTKLKLATAWTGANLTGVPFAIIRNLTNASNFDLMKKIEEFLTDRQRTLDEFVDWINAEPVTTGAADAGKFPMTDRYGVTVYLKSPRQLDYEHNLRVQQQEDLIDETQAALTDAEARLLAIGNQQTWADQILGYKNAAAASATLAQKWAENPENTAVVTGQFSAKHHALKAAASATSASSSATSATASKNAAATSETNAAASATTASTKASEAATSATNAAGSATGAANSATAAQTAKNAAEAAKTAAETAKTAAETARAGAQTAEANAASSASSAQTSSNTARDWAEKTGGPVSGGQYSAKHHATAAANSAADAQTRQNDVITRQNDVITRQTDVTNRQSNVVSLEASATSSKNAAATSATTASTKATEASTSASAAATSATAASASEVKAGKWAEEAVDVAVETGKFSAKHHATKAATSASNAASSATAASASKTAAESAKTAAETAKTAAQTAKTAAESAKTAAETARDQAVLAAGSLTGSMSELGSIDLSSGVYPTKPSTAAFWKVTVGGTVGTDVYGVGDTLVYSKNLDQFYKIDNTESVSSVNGKTGVVTLNASDVGALGAGATAVAASKLATARTISLTGDATGSVSFDGSANASITVVVVDDSHNHVISNVDGLQAALDGKQAALGFTPVQQGTGAGQSTNIVKIGWSASGLLLQVDATDFANNWPISISKNAATATKLATSRTINGVAFDGSANITIADSTKEPAITAGGTVHYWRGDKTWRDFATDVRAAALTGLSVSTNAAIAATDSILVAAGKLQAQITALANQQAASAGSADKLTTARTISLTGDASGSVAFDGSANVSIAVIVTDDSHNHVIGNVDGLQAALDAKAPLASPSFTGATSMTGGAHAPWAELRSNGGTPFLDFSNDASTDFDVRLILSSDDLLELYGGSFKVNGEQYVTGWVRSTGSNGIYWESYGGGWHMTDTTWMRCYGGKPLYVANQIAASGNIIAYYSDERLKENIKPIENALWSVTQLTGVRYNANELAATFGYDRGKKEIGLLAQDVKKVAPEAVELAPFDVSEDPNVSKSGENYLTLKYERLVPLLVEAIKELKAELDELKAELRLREVA